MMETKICTLMYHDAYVNSKSESGFNFDSANSYKIKRDEFEYQVQAINDCFRKEGKNKSYVRFTFDDGGVSAYTIFAPILEKYGFKGIFFIATDYLNKEGFLSDQQIIDLHRRGHIIGSHSHSHRQRMNSLPKKELFEDWKNSKDCLQDIIKEPISVASLPNGYSSTQMLEALAELGFKEVYTSDARENVNEFSGMHIFGRYGIKDGMKVRDVVDIVFDRRTKLKIQSKKKFLRLLKKILGKYYVSIREYLYHFINEDDAKKIH